MYKTIIIIVIFYCFINAGAQNLSVSDVKVSNKIEMFKEKVKNRKIEYKKELLNSHWTKKLINPTSISKDSLRHYLSGNNMNDFNFELFQLKLKNIQELDESLLQNKYPKLFSIMSERLYNRVVYNYDKINSGIILTIILSENIIEFDDVIEGRLVEGAGYYLETITYKGKSDIEEIFFSENEKYTGVMKPQKGIRQQIQLNKENRFEIILDVSSHHRKYFCIENKKGEKLSIVRVY